MTENGNVVAVVVDLWADFFECQIKTATCVMMNVEAELSVKCKCLV